MSDILLTITGAELQVGDVISNQFGDRKVTAITRRTIYAVEFTCEKSCKQCVVSNRSALTVRR